MTRPNILPQHAVQLAIILRVWSDLLAGAPIADTAWTWAHAMSVGACFLLALCFREQLLPSHSTERRAVGLLIALCLIGLARSDDTVDAVLAAAHVLSPLLVLFAVRAAAMQPRRWVDTVLAASVLPLGLALWHAVQGQHLEQLVHGYPRLQGGYLNYHNLGLTSALIVPLAAWRATTLREQHVPALLCVAIGSAALYCLGMTWVRTGWVFLFVSVVVGLLTAREWKTSFAIVAVTSLGLLLNPVLSERFADILSLLSGQAPENGWGAIGSSRFAIWRDVVGNVAALDPWAWLCGVGLGEQNRFHPKGLDPHLDYLSLMIQLGAVGLLGYLTLLYHYGRTLFSRRRTEVGPLVMGVFVGSLVVNGISNAFLARPTIAWILFGLIGTVWCARERTQGCRVDHRPQEQDRLRHPVEPASG